LDGDKLNNDPRNLDWGTQEQNWADRAFHGHGVGEKHHSARLTEKDAQQIRESQLSQRTLAARFGVAQSQVWSIRNGRTWANHKPIGPNIPRWTHPITLRITDVRVERVQDITVKDIKDEGMGNIVGIPEWDSTVWEKAYTTRFAELWDSINAKRGYSWGNNPWCWMIEFRRTNV
jgi:hypothetical protein